MTGVFEPSPKMVRRLYLPQECTLQSHDFLGPLLQEAQILDISHLKLVHLKSLVRTSQGTYDRNAIVAFQLVGIK